MECFCFSLLLLWGGYCLFVFVTLLRFSSLQLSPCSLGRHSDISAVGGVLFYSYDVTLDNPKPVILNYYSFRFLYSSAARAPPFSLSLQAMGVIRFRFLHKVGLGGSYVMPSHVCSIFLHAGLGLFWWPRVLCLTGWSVRASTCAFFNHVGNGFLVFTCLGWSFVLLGITFSSRGDTL